MDIPLDRITDYFAILHRCLEETAASDSAGRPIGIEVAFSRFAGAATRPCKWPRHSRAEPKRRRIP
ncbi:MAG: hypothetical protein ACT4P2_05905 [Pseudomonadota bacterium]